MTTMTIKRILVPLDGSRAAEGALIQARMLARMNQAEITLLRVVAAGTAIHPTADGQLHAVHEDAHAAEYLETVAAGLSAERIACERLIVHGKPAPAILQVARDLPADLILTSSQGRNAVQRALIGSVTDGVIRHGGTPVLVTHPEPARG